MSIEDILQQQITWHSKANQGCIFAAYLFKHSPSESKLNRFCFDEDLSNELILKIANITESNITDRENHMVSFILPRISSKEGLLEFLDLVRSNTNWTIQDSDRHNNDILVRLRVPFNEFDADSKQVYAWVLGFAPLDFLPITRRSPFFEIMLATKSKMFFKEEYNKFSLTQHVPGGINRNTQSDDAHLADLYMNDVTDNPRKDKLLWKQSTERKWYLLRKSGQETDINAKAKVTFSYPI